jgi:DNA-binding NtrC family response regulator
LREVAEDIPTLANHFLQKHCALAQTEFKQFSPAAMDRLLHYSWPGNTRQLENEVKRLVASVRGKLIDADQLSLPPATAETEPLRNTAKTLTEAVEQLEREMIESALNDCGGNKQRAAQTLGLSRQGLIKKLKRLGLPAA